MKWLEIIELRSVDSNKEFLESQMQKLIIEVDKEVKKQALRIYSRAIMDTNFRVRSKITLHFRVSSRPHDKARGGRIASLFNRQTTQSCGMNRLDEMRSYF